MTAGEEESQSPSGYRILLYGDFRSPHAQGMADGLRRAGHEVLAVSSEIVSPDIALSPSSWLSRKRSVLVARMRDHTQGSRQKVLSRLSGVGLAHTVLALTLLPSRRRQLKRAIATFIPDLLHGLRLPYEGLTLLSMKTTVPRVVSTWGLDFEPGAAQDPLLRLWLRSSLFRARGIHVDARADHSRAISYGFSSDAPMLFAAGNFGIDHELFHPRDAVERGLVVFARRPVPTVDYRAFVGAALALRERSDIRIVAPNLLEVKPALEAEFGPALADSVEFLPRLDRQEFAALLRRAHVVVSPALADGTPNTVLEAIASRSRVVAGRLPQLEALKQREDVLVLIDRLQSSTLADAIEEAVDRGPLEEAPELPVEFNREHNTRRFSLFYEAVLRSGSSAAERTT